MYSMVKVGLRAPYSGFGADSCTNGEVMTSKGCQPSCPEGHALDFDTNKCEPSCPKGQILNLDTLKCEIPTDSGMSTNTKLLIGGAAVLAAVVLLR